ncbi:MULTISPECIES: Tim44/TimA family putative adaptor protein [unclassified Sphingomonas]|uniref:Tim44/TimA family putative adaptor protein n=1 Tax=unclassified Sphingomonas TaxID=196159 RepID=UPI000A5BA332|nr:MULTISPECIES: Tim44/TimA family putative adaptor protein [unclassified Sphingomonas]
MLVFVVLLAMVAAFLAMRLYAVLGKRTGAEPLPRAAEERLGTPPVARPVEVQGEPRAIGPRQVDAGAENGLRAVIAADPSFDVAQFLDGAKSAYRMILEAYWKGDQDSLEWLTEREVRDAFVEAIAERTAAGHVLDNRLVTIERAAVTEASVEAGVARITVRFDADIASITRDADGTIIAGSMSDAVETHDMWTFARAVRSADPNWKLADTDEA